VVIKTANNVKIENRPSAEGRWGLEVETHQLVGERDHQQNVRALTAVNSKCGVHCSMCVTITYRIIYLRHPIMQVQAPLARDA